MVVFAFIYFRIGTFNTALAGALIALALILVLEGFIVFRRMAEHIEQLSATMAQAETGKMERVQDAGETKELAMIADTFNRTLAKLEETVKELGVRAVQAATLNEIREIVSTSINMEEVAKVILARTMEAVNSQAGYLAVKHNGSPTFQVAAASGINEKIPDKIELDANKTLAGLIIKSKPFLLIEDVEKEPQLRELNRPDLGLPCLLGLSIIARGIPIGVLVLGKDKTKPPFVAEDIQFLQTLLQQVAYSVQNARLYENLQHSNQELENALKSQSTAQSQLLSSARMAAFGELSVNIAHELNNPLTGILGYTDFILRYSVEEAKKREYLEEIRSQAVRASQIIKSLLDLASTKPGSKIQTDLNDLVKKTLLLTKGRILKCGIHLDLRLANKLPLVMADPAQIGQVFFNLVSNALNAMTGAFKPPSGAAAKDLKANKKHRLLRIESGKRGQNVYVSFQDTGSGIAPEHLLRIFEPFYSTQDKVSEVGLGLWVSHRTVTAHGGDITVKSDPERGSIFVVVLPVGV